jgi:hypothetical protein
LWSYRYANSGQWPIRGRIPDLAPGSGRLDFIGFFKNFTSAGLAALAHVAVFNNSDQAFVDQIRLSLNGAKGPRTVFSEDRLESGIDCFPRSWEAI